MEWRSRDHTPSTSRDYCHGNTSLLIKTPMRMRKLLRHSRAGQILARCVDAAHSSSFGFLTILRGISAQCSGSRTLRRTPSNQQWSIPYTVSEQSVVITQCARYGNGGLRLRLWLAISPTDISVDYPAATQQPGMCKIWPTVPKCSISLPLSEI